MSLLDNPRLTLARGICRSGPRELRCRETKLEFHQDRAVVVLSHYTECYGEQSAEWLEERHEVEIESLLAWIRDSGRASQRGTLTQDRDLWLAVQASDAFPEEEWCLMDTRTTVD